MNNTGKQRTKKRVARRKQPNLDRCAWKWQNKQKNKIIHYRLVHTHIFEHICLNACIASDIRIHLRAHQSNLVVNQHTYFRVETLEHSINLIIVIHREKHTNTECGKVSERRARMWLIVCLHIIYLWLIFGVTFIHFLFPSVILSIFSVFSLSLSPQPTAKCNL